MATTKKSELVQKLQDEKEQVVAEIERLRAALKIEVDTDADEGDPDMAEREKVIALLNTMEHRMDAVEYALRQAQKGTYGRCDRCGEPIDPARLEALPEATQCIKCKAIVERQSRLLSPEVRPRRTRAPGGAG